MSESEAEAIVTQVTPRIEVLAVAALHPITTPFQYEASAASLREVKERIAALEAEQKRLTDPLSLALSRIRDLFRKPLDRLKEIERGRKAAQLTYRQEAERKRLAEQARLQEAARAEAKGNADRAEEIRAAVPTSSPPSSRRRRSRR